MAIDSETKRKSIAGVSRTWRPTVIVPTGGFDQADRQAIGWSYSGILAGAAAPSVDFRKLITIGVVDRLTDVRGTVGARK